MKKHLYANMTWEEVAEAVADRRVVVIPVGAIEQHGPHLPINTDNLAVNSVAELAAAKASGILLCAPPIHYGFNEHNMDFPGTITVQIETLLNYAFEVGQSFAAQGFERLLFFNGHGSNGPVYNLAARKITNRTSLLAATINWWDLAWPVIEEVCQGLPESVDHACEFETSVYEYLAGDLVKLDQIRDEVARDRGGPTWLYPQMGGSNAVQFMNWWSRMSDSGVNGRPSLATPAKGERIVGYAVDALVQVATEFRALSEQQRIDHQVHLR